MNAVHNFNFYCFINLVHTIALLRSAHHNVMFICHLCIVPECALRSRIFDRWFNFVKLFTHFDLLKILISNKNIAFNKTGINISHFFWVMRNSSFPNLIFKDEVVPSGILVMLCMMRNRIRRFLKTNYFI